jgi:hypothetical protein
LRTASGHDQAGEVAFARVLSRDGRWVVLHGAALAGDTPRVAVIIEPAHPARIAPLLMAAYGLTQREQEVTRLVLCGDSTDDIAARLFVSPHTVQQHLKRIFRKDGACAAAVTSWLRSFSLITRRGSVTTSDGLRAANPSAASRTRSTDVSRRPNASL